MSNGLGDTIASVTHFLGIDKVAEAVAKLAGAKGCGCAERQEYLNQLFPYDSYKRTFKVSKDIFMGDLKYYNAGDDVTVNKIHVLFPNVINLVRDGYLTEV